MYCKRCGAQIDTTKRQADGSVVCPGCGLIYRQKAASAPARAANPAPVREAAPAPRPAVNDTAGETPKRGLNPVLIILAVLILIGAAAGAILYFRSSGKTGSSASVKTPGPQYTQTGGKNDTPKKEITVPCLYRRAEYTNSLDTGTLYSRSVYTYEYSSNGLLQKMTYTPDIEDSYDHLDVYYYYELDGHGFPTKVWTGFESIDHGGNHYSFKDDEEFIAAVESGTVDEDYLDGVGLWLFRADMENTYSQDGTMTVRLSNPRFAGEAFSFEEDLNTGTYGIFEMAIRNTFVQSPKYCNAGIFWGENGVVRKNGKQIYSCSSSDPYTKVEEFVEEINGCQRMTVRNSSRGSGGEWEVGVETITETDSDGYIVSYRKGNGVSYTESIVVREDESNSVTVRIIDPGTGTVTCEYSYDKPGVLREIKSFFSDREMIIEFDNNGDTIKKAETRKTPFDENVRTVCEYQRGEFTLYE